VFPIKVKKTYKNSLFEVRYYVEFHNLNRNTRIIRQKFSQNMEVMSLKNKHCASQDQYLVGNRYLWELRH